MDIVDQIVALGARDTCDLGRISGSSLMICSCSQLPRWLRCSVPARRALHVLQEIAEDSNCAVHVDPDQVAIVGH